MKTGTKHTWIYGCFLLSVILLGFASCAAFPESDLTRDSVPKENFGEENQGYRIHAGDVVLIDVWRVPVLSQKVKVRMDGTFLYPLLGTVPAEGKTVDELRGYLTDELKKGYLVDPVVTVVLDSGTQGFYVVGEVKRPGAFKLEEKIDVHQAIITAGGFTDFASKRVKIIRKTGNQKKEIKVNIDQFTKSGRANPEAEIQPGDTVVVPKRLL